MPLDIKVKRRYSDFENLRNHLSNQFPGLFVKNNNIKLKYFIK